MKPIKDLTGQRFGKLLVVSREPTRVTPSGQKKTIWKCICDCGNETTPTYQTLTDGVTKSCGCHKTALAKERLTIHGHHSKPEYQVWRDMIRRCTNVKHKNYADYGGRGIKVCDRWLESFENFFEDMGERPEGLTLDRTNNDDGYNEVNCRWVDWYQQASNRRGSTHNTSGRIGVKQEDTCWVAKITHKGEVIRIGRYSSFEEACKARESAELKYFGFIKSHIKAGVR